MPKSTFTEIGYFDQAMPHHQEAGLGEQYDDREQQRVASTIGMWVFLSTEVLFFGVLILGFTAYFFLYPESFREGVKGMEIVIGTVNTAILLTSSLTMALSVDATKGGRYRLAANLLFLTVALGAAFLFLKGVEYHAHIREHKLPGAGFTAASAHPGQVEMFYFLYFAATGTHALHLTIGCVAALVVALRTRRGEFTPVYYNPVHVMGLYWHFIDIVWVFLFPLFYLLGRVG